MRIALITPWPNVWVPMFERAVLARGHEFHLLKPGGAMPAGIGVVLHGWFGQSNPLPGARNVYFLRSYELFDGSLIKADFSHIEALIVVNDWIKERVVEILTERGIEVPVHRIYNTVHLPDWGFAERVPGNRIGMACHVHPKKGLPLAAQIVAALPCGAELHIAGAVQDNLTANYLDHFGRNVQRRVFLYGEIESGQMDAWWEDKSFCLSTSLREGNPNNVIEAMAKGIKPIVHRWPGADTQFPSHCLFDTVSEALARMRGEYHSEQYRAWARNRYGPENIERVLDIAMEDA